MKQENYTQSFVQWVRANEARLNADHITVRLPEKIIGNGTHADFSGEAGEATVEIWDYGFSELHFAGPEAEQVSVTHHEFQNMAEMYAALDGLVNRMSLKLAEVR